LDEALSLTDIAVEVLAEGCTRKNGHEVSVGLLRQSLLGRLARCDDVNEVYRLCLQLRDG